MSGFQAADPGFFRIERKRLLEQRMAEKKKLLVVEDKRTNELVVGTHSSCGLTLDDPIAAERHCVLVQRDGKYWIRDLHNASGTFLNGLQIEEETSLSVGDRIALGAAILEIHQDEELPEALCLHVHEGGFFHTLKKQGEFASDADEWVRSEVTFGRTPKLRILNWITGAVALFLGIWMFTQSSGESSLQPGHLIAAHAQLFMGSDGSSVSLPPGYPSMSSMVDLAQRKGCAACHDSFGTPTSEKCATCHQEVVRAAVAREAHPFKGGDDLVCIDCHREHFGETPIPNLVTPDHFEGRCKDCHGDEYGDPASLLAGLRHASTEYKLSVTSEQLLPRRVSRGFEAFSHGAHSKIQDCATCHKQGEGSEPSDFASLSFETCDQCHASDLSSPDGLAMGVELPPDDKRWTVNWHGAGEGEKNCRQCHEAPYAPGLKSLQRTDPVTLAFDLGLRSHGDQFHLTAKPEDCTRCHLSGQDLPLGRMFLGRPFRHDIHLSALIAGDGASQEVINRQCAECHTDMESSSALSSAPGVYSGPSLEVCTKCHQETDGLALITAPGVPTAQPVSRTASAFPHDRHVAIEGGCIACHEFRIGAAMISTPPARAACSRCHMDQSQGISSSHANIGGGDCSACHQPSSTLQLAGILSSVFYGPRDKTPGASGFPHHLEGHKRATCRECHGDPAKLGEVHSPSQDAAACRDCHAGSRFHWR